MKAVPHKKCPRLLAGEMGCEVTFKNNTLTVPIDFMVAGKMAVIFYMLGSLKKSGILKFVLDWQKAERSQIAIPTGYWHDGYEFFHGKPREENIVPLEKIISKNYKPRPVFCRIKHE